MKQNLLSTGFGIILALGLLLPLSPSFIAVNSAATINVHMQEDSCIKFVGGKKLNSCDMMIQPQDVSWNSGGG